MVTNAEFTTPIRDLLKGQQMKSALKKIHPALPPHLAAMDAQWVYLTKDIAERLLDPSVNYGNRTISSLVVSKYVRDKRQGAWNENEQGMAVTGPSIDDPGQLVDGQHRATAVSITGIGGWVRFTFNAAGPNSKRDQGRGRGHGAFLRWRDGTNADHPKLGGILAALAKLSGNKSNVLTAASRQDIIDLHEEAIRWVLYAFPLKKSFCHLTAVLAYAYPVDKERVQKFADELLRGIGLREDSPSLAIRNLLFDRVDQRDLITSMQRTFNALKAQVQGRRGKRFDDSNAGYLFFQAKRREMALPA